MSTWRSQRWAAALIICCTGVWLVGCPGRKQVPFGLEDAGADEGQQSPPEQEEAPTPLPTGKRFEPNQVEVPVGESALVLESGYALAALEVDLDGTDPLDALVVSADSQQVTLHAADARGLSVAARRVDSFLVPNDCAEPLAEATQLSPSLVAIRVEHSCETGKRANHWIVTIEAQPRVRERITVLPPSERSSAPIEVELRAEDRDGDGYEDVVAEIQIGEAEIPLTWLNRPGGFARDPSEPERTLSALADEAWSSLSSNAPSAEKRALQVIEVFIALCREGGAARLGFSGTQGLQCQQSPAAARAVSVAMAVAIRRGTFVRALELQRWWEDTALQPTPEERELIQNAWRKAKASAASASWRLLDTSSAPVSLQFVDDDTLIVNGSAPRTIDLSSGTKTALSASQIQPATRDPESRFAVRGVRATCAGFEAEVGPIGGKQSHRVLVQRRADGMPCKTPIDRPASVFEWAVVGWAPQGLVAASGDLLRVIPLNELAKPAGSPIELSPSSPLPAPIRGARATPDGSRYVIPHEEGVVVRDWRKSGAGLWLRPSDWNTVSGELRSLAISPDGTKVAVQKGNEIRLLTW
ncbi:MAG TPA: hypothetical protein VLS88_07755 [Polyangiales bacterium]|nr:hypothetical protein [Polyangiales bacterium]